MTEVGLVRGRKNYVIESTIEGRTEKTKEKRRTEVRGGSSVVKKNSLIV